MTPPRRRARRASRRLCPSEVALASTGAISHYLAVDAVLKGTLARPLAAPREGDVDFQRRSRPPTRSEKRANLEVQLPSGNVRLCAQCKGAGMISPRFATMLCFVQTDAALAPETAELLLGVCVKRSFDRAQRRRAAVHQRHRDPDGLRLQRRRVAPESEDELRFGEALDALLRALAVMIVADGEGAGRIGRVLVRGGDSERGRGGRARGRQLAAGEGRAARGRPELGPDRAGRRARPCPASEPLAIDVWIEGTQVCSAGVALAYEEDALAQAVAREEVEYEIALPGEGAETEVFFSDLSHDYVTLNADYTT